jgi:hypothetical protein
LSARKSSPIGIGRLLLAIAVGALLAALITVLTPDAEAATTPTAPTPIPVSVCDGSLSPATPTVDDPNLLNYKFYCDGEVTAYTVIVNRPGHIDDEIDDFETSTSVFEPNSGALITSLSFNCTGTIPGGGVGCFAGTGNFAPPYASIEGQFDTSDPFCANLPKDAKPGTKPEPGASAQLVVTDATGAEQGPFLLPIAPGCKAVKPVPKPKPKKHKRHGNAAGKDERR